MNSDITVLNMDPKVSSATENFLVTILYDNHGRRSGGGGVEGNKTPPVRMGGTHHISDPPQFEETPQKGQQFFLTCQCEKKC